MASLIDQERRRSGRRRVEIRIILLLDSEGSQSNGVLCETTTVDCSDEGARICANIAGLRPGSVLVLAATGDTEGVVPGRVVWVTPPGPNRAGQAGVKFLHGSHLRCLS